MRHKLFSIFVILLFITWNSAFSQATKTDKSATKEPEKTQYIEDVVKSCKLSDGLFKMYRDTATGKVSMLIRKNQLDIDFIYFMQLIDGPGENFLARGTYTEGKIFRISKFFDKIQFALENTSYYFDPQNALSKAAEAGINKPIIFSIKITATNKEQTEFLIDVTDLFINESFNQIKSSPDPNAKPGQSFNLGNANKEKSKITLIKNYPANTDVETEVIYEDPLPMYYGGAFMTDQRFVTLKFHHCFIEYPKNNFKPRMDDPRVGFFTNQVTDMTSTSVTPYRDMIARWNLEKKDKNAAVSEPVNPIVWWIENTTPKELRPTIKNAVETWNFAFEQAGFKNAVIVKEQPDNADWDAGDIRYNVLRWVSFPNMQYGGYGPSFTNPRTGEILGADVMLDYSMIKGDKFQIEIFDNLFSQPDNKFYPHQQADNYFMMQSANTGKAMLDAMGSTDFDKKEFQKQSLSCLVIHEVGHTLGLSHNFKGSNLYSPEEINKKGNKHLTGSIMEYLSANISSDPNNQGLYYDTMPGPYDNWAILYGYSTDDSKLPEILNRSTEHELLFGNDAETMRSGGTGIDPRNMVFDMSSDAMNYSNNRIDFLYKIIPKLKTKSITDGLSYQKYYNHFYYLLGNIRYSLQIISMQVGGVYIDRSMAGQKGATTPFIPVAYEKQKNAMKILTEKAFSPDAFKIPAETYSYLLMQRRGFDAFGINEDPKIHTRFLTIQNSLLDQLLHKNTLQRITDSEVYGNKYKIGEFFSDLTNAIFINQKISNTIQQNLQNSYVQRLIQISDSKSDYCHQARILAFENLKTIKNYALKFKTEDATAKAHFNYLVFQIDKVFEKK